MDARGYVPSVEDNLLPSVRLEDFEADLKAGAGKELDDKFQAIHSSAALVVNAFGPFGNRCSELTLFGSGPFTRLQFERKCPTGMTGTPPHLDVLLEGPKTVIGIEAKLLETLCKHRASFSPQYRERIRDGRRDSAWFREMLRVDEAPDSYVWLDAAQLVKHAFGLAHTFRGKAAILLYLYWEPRNAERFPFFSEHRREVETFLARVDGSYPAFRAMNYQTFWNVLSAKASPWLSKHLQDLRARYYVSP